MMHSSSGNPIRCHPAREQNLLFSTSPLHLGPLHPFSSFLPTSPPPSPLPLPFHRSPSSPPPFTALSLSRFFPPSQNSVGEESHLAIETSGHGALKENRWLDDGAYLMVRCYRKAPYMSLVS